MSSVTEISDSNLSSSPITCILPQPPSEPCRPASVPVNVSNTSKRLSDKIRSDMYVKRDRKSSDNSCILEEAVAAMKDLSKEGTPQTDAYDHFGAYVAAQLRMLTPEQRAFCEIEIVKIISSTQSHAQS